MVNLNDAIAAAGGLVTPESCPKVVSEAQLAEIDNTLIFLRGFYENIFNNVNPKNKKDFSIALTNSPAFSGRVQRLENGDYVILVPLGMPARLRVLARILLRYWGRESRALILRSSLDQIPDDGKAVPRLLRPIFMDNLDFENYWEEIYELDSTIEIDPKTENDVYELVYLSLVYLISHEFTHVLHGHFDLRESAQKDKLGLSQTELIRGLELDADDGAAALSMKILLEGIDSAIGDGQWANHALGWLRLSYVATMLFGIFDTHRKFLGAYDTGEYNHPVVRREIFALGMMRSFNGPDDIRDILLRSHDEGWQRCVFAFTDLNLDAMQGTFGDMPAGYIEGPLQSLLYGTPGGAASKVEMDLIKTAKENMQLVRKFLPVFQNIE